MLTERPMHRVDAYEMVRRRTAEAGFKGKLGCHVFRATGITANLEEQSQGRSAPCATCAAAPRCPK
jgi:hypothetical protein